MTREVGERTHELAVAAALVVALGLYDSWVLGLPYVRYFARSARADGLARLSLHAGGALAIAALQILFVRAALVSSRSWKVCYGLVFALVTFLEFGYVRATGSLINAHDIEVAFENTKYWTAMAGAFVNWAALVPVAVFFAAVASYRPRSGGHWRRAAGVALATLLVHSSYAVSGLVHRMPDVGGLPSNADVPTGSFQGFARSVTLFGWNRALGAFHYRLRADVGFHAASTPTQHVVLVIDESVAAGHLSIDGYPRTTTPWLAELASRGRVRNWGVAAAATNLSNGSVLCLLTGVNEVPDLARSSLQQPTAFQFAKAMNYGTHLLDGQARDRRFGISWDDLRAVDDFRTATAFGDDPDVDFRVATAVADILRSATGQFVVVLKRGNHFPHASNYPPSAAIWTPTTADRPATGDRNAALTNTYDNAIRYNVDGFFRALLRADGSLERTALIYTSDHGEVLGGEGTEPLVRTMAWGIAAVPLLMLGDAAPAVDVGYAPSHHNIFPTLLDLMGVPAAYRSAHLARSLLAARATDHDRRLVLDGPLLEATGVSVHDFDELTRPAALGRDVYARRDKP